MKNRLIKITLIAVLTLVNIWFINYMETKSQHKPQDLQGRIKIPRNG